MLEGFRGRWLRFCNQNIKIQHGTITCGFARSLIINQWSHRQNNRKHTQCASHHQMLNKTPSRIGVLFEREFPCLSRFRVHPKVSSLAQSWWSSSVSSEGTSEESQSVTRKTYQQSFTSRFQQLESLNAGFFGINLTSWILLSPSLPKRIPRRTPERLRRRNRGYTQGSRPFLMHPSSRQTFRTICTAH